MRAAAKEGNAAEEEGMRWEATASNAGPPEASVQRLWRRHKTCHARRRDDQIGNWMDC